MKTNKKAVDTRSNTEVRLAGGFGAPSANQEAEALLRRSVMASLLFEGLFYEDGMANAENVKALIPQVDPVAVSKIAIEARHEQKLRHMPLFIVNEMVKHVSIASKPIDGEVDDPRLRLAEIHFDPNTPWVCEEHVTSFAIDILSVRSSAARRFFGVEPAGFRVEAVARSEIPIIVDPFFHIELTQLLTSHLIQDKRRHLPEFVRELVGEFADGDFVGGDFLFALLFVLHELLGKSKCFIEVGTEFFSVIPLS